MPLKIEIQGDKQARNNLGQFSRALGAEANDIIREVAEYTVQIARHEAPEDLGAGKRSIHAEVHGLHAEVTTSKAYMVVQEYGRAPGATPPTVAHIAGWGIRHGFAESQLYMLAQSIGRKGFAGKLFMSQAAVAADVYLRERMRLAGAKITKFTFGRF